VSERRTSALSDPGDRWANLEALGRAAQGRQPRRDRRRGRRVVLRVLAIGLAVVLVVAAVGAALGYRYADKLIGKGHRKVANLSPASAGRPMNLLLVGSDSREGLNKTQLARIETTEVAGQRTDTIILLHVSPKRKKAVMVSIPRDLRVTIRGRAEKINAAYAFGGPDLLVKTVQETTGLPINHYVEIDFAGFLKVVDALGGVRLCNRTGHRLDDSYANLHMAPGCQDMNGVQALAFVRARHVDSDFGRIGRQQEFLRAVMDKVASRGNLINLPKLLHIAEIASDHVRTDDTLKTREALGLARRIGRLDPASVDMRVYPSVAAPPACAGCAAFVEPLPEASILMKALADDAPELPPVGLPGGKGTSLRDVRVTVLNGGGVQGAAARTAASLQRLGVQVAGTGNAPKPTGDRSTLAYPARLEEQAKLLGYLLGSQVQLTRAATDRGVLVLTVGSGFRPPGSG
jgi:LCP family protein required for cell wall assembly